MASNNHSSDLEHAYNLLSNKLRKLGYNLPIGIESTQLVDRLLTELIAATQGYEKLHNNYKKQKSELEAEKKICLPLRNENMKFVRENNELHLEIIKIREEFERNEISLSTSISKLNKEKQEMRFLIIQKDSHNKKIENELENLRKRLNEITEKIYGDSIKSKKRIINNSVAIAKIQNDNIINNDFYINSNSNIIGKKQEMLMPRGLLDDPSDFEFPSDVRKIFKEIEANKEQWACDIKACDERAGKFRDEIKKLVEDNKNLIAKVEFLERQKGLREQEIKRISANYSTTDNIEEIKVKYNAEQLKKQVEKLNAQIDFLNKENHKNADIAKLHYSKCNLEEQKKNEKIVKNLKLENEKLKKEISEINNEDNNDINDNKNKNNSNRSNNKSLEENPNSKMVFEENLRLKKDLADLLSKLATASSQSEVLTHESEKLKQLNVENSSYVNTDRAALLKNLNLLKDQVKELKAQVINSESKCDFTAKQNENLRSELNLIKGKELLKNLDYDSNGKPITKLYKEYSELAEENKNIRKKLNDFESSNLIFAKVQSTLTKEKENLQNINLALESKLCNMEDELSKIKFLNNNSSNDALKRDGQIAVLDSKLKAALVENANLVVILENKSSLHKDAESKNDNYFKQIQNANDTMSNLQIEYKNLSKEFTDLMSKYKRQEEKVKSYEKDFCESKYIKEKLADYEEIAKSAKAERLQFESANRLLRSETAKLSEELNSLKSQEAEGRKIIEILREEKHKLLKQLELNSNDLLNLEEKVCSQDSIAVQIAELHSKISELQAKLISKVSLIEKQHSDLSIAEFEVKKKNMEIARFKELLEQSKLELNAKCEETKHIKEQAERLKVELLEKKIESNSSLSANLLELQEKYTHEKIQADKANFTIRDLNEKMLLLSHETENLSSKITNMTKLLAEADSTRAEMFSKLQHEIGKSKFYENENLILKEKEQKVLAEILSLQEENKQIKGGITSLDQNYDLLNNELDLKTEEISKLNLIIKNLKEANDELSKNLSVQLSKCSTDSKRLSEREQELKETRVANSKMQKEIFEFNALLQQKNLETQELSFEIKRVSEENAHLQDHMMRLSQENEKLSLIKSQLEMNSDFIAQKYRSNELDMNDLFNSYKDACKENERLKKNLQIFLDENKQAFNHIRSLESNLSNAMNNIQQSIIEKESLLKKIEMMEAFESELSLEIDRLREKLESKISTEDKLKRNIELDQEINMNYENHNLKLQKQIVKMENEKKELEEIINNLKNQIDYLNHLNKKQEFDMNNLELILVDERKKLHNLDCVLNKMNEDKEKLKHENNQLINMIGENSDMKNLKSKVGFNDNFNNFYNKSDNILNKNFNEEDNNVLRMLVNDLQGQLVSMQNELKSVREENTRLLSERSISKNFMSDRLFSPSSPSNKSDSRGGN